MAFTEKSQHTKSTAAIVFSRVRSEEATLAFAPPPACPSSVSRPNPPPGLQYALKCSGADPKPEPDCENLEYSIEEAQETNEEIGVPIYVYLAGDDISYQGLACDAGFK